MAISTTISAGEKSKYRGAHHWEENKIMNVVPKTTFATAVINQSSFAFPLSQITVDNTSAEWLNVENGMMYFVGSTAGAYDVSIGIVRKPPTSTIFYPDVKSRGDTGYPTGTKGITKPYTDNYFITVLKYFPMYGELSRFTTVSNADGDIFKFYDRQYIDETRNLEPTANIGKWAGGYVDANTGLFTITRSTTNSLARQGKTIDSVLWDLDGGSTDNALTDTTVTMSFTEGFYIVKCIVTDTEGKTHIARIYVWANTRTGNNRPYSDKYAVDRNSIRIRADRKGGTMKFTADGIGHLTDIFPNTAFLYSEVPMTDGGELTDTRQFTCFAGYLEGYDLTRTKNAETSDFDVSSPMKRAFKTVCAPQYLTQKSAPTDWSQISTLTAETALDYLIRWHVPQLLENHDYIVSGDLSVYRKKSYVFNMDGLGNQITQLEQMALINVGSLDDGTTLVCILPTYMNNADRNDLEIMFDWTRDDYGTPEQTSVESHASIGYATGIVWTYDGTVSDGFKAGSAGRIQGQANPKPNMSTMVVPNTRSDYNPNDNGNIPFAQYRAMEIVGHHFAYENRPVKAFDATPFGNYDFVHPADLREWQVFSDREDIIPDDQDYARCLPSGLSRTIRRGGKTLTHTYEPESFGLLGIPLPLDRSGALSFLTPDFWLLNLGELYDPVFEGFSLDTADWGLLYAWNDFGILARTLNALGSSPHWEAIAGIDGKVIDCEWSYSTQNIYAVTWDSVAKTARIYIVSSVESATPLVTEKESWSITDDTFDGRLVIEGDIDNSNRVIIAWKTEKTVYEFRMDNATAQWDSADIATVTTQTTGDPIQAITDFSVAVIDEQFYVSSQTTDGEWSIYRADEAGAFALVEDQVGDTETSRNPIPTLNALATNSVVASVNLINTTASVSVGKATVFDRNHYEQDLYARGSDADLATVIGGTYRYGLYQRYITQEQAVGKVAEVSEVRATLRITSYYPPDDGDPSASPTSYFPPDQNSNYPLSVYEIDYRFRIWIRNKIGSIIGSATVDSNSFEGTIARALLPSPSLIDNIRVYHDVTVTWTPASDTQISFIDVEFLEDDDRDTFSSDGGGFLRALAPEVFRPYHGITLTGIVYDLENVIEDGWRLYKVTNADNVNPTWADVSPSNGIPQTKYALSIDVGDNTQWGAVGTSDDERSLLYTDDTGATWTKIEDTDYIGVKRSGNALLAWGHNRLDLSEDLMTTRISRLGDWASNVGTVGTIRGALAKFER